MISIGVLSSFYIANWDEYHCGVLRTNFLGIGVTEVHLLLTSIFLIEGLSNGSLSSITNSEIGKILLPSIKEQ